MACLNTLKKEIRSVERVFHKSHEMFQVVSASVDELTCRFICKNGKKHDITANITETYPHMPPVWFADTEDSSITGAVEGLSSTSGLDNHVINQVAILVRGLCTAQGLPEPSSDLEKQTLDNHSGSGDAKSLHHHHHGSPSNSNSTSAIPPALRFERRIADDDALSGAAGSSQTEFMAIPANRVDFISTKITEITESSNCTSISFDTGYQVLILLGSNTAIENAKTEIGTLLENGRILEGAQEEIPQAVQCRGTNNGSGVLVDSEESEGSPARAESGANGRGSPAAVNYDGSGRGSPAEADQERVLPNYSEEEQQDSSTSRKRKRDHKVDHDKNKRPRISTKQNNNTAASGSPLPLPSPSTAVPGNGDLQPPPPSSPPHSPPPSSPPHPPVPTSEARLQLRRSIRAQSQQQPHENNIEEGVAPVNPTPRARRRVRGAPRWFQNYNRTAQNHNRTVKTALSQMLAVLQEIRDNQNRQV